MVTVQWVGLHASTAGGMGVIPGQGTKILYALQQSQKKTPKKQQQQKTRESNTDEIYNFRVRYV